LSAIEFRYVPANGTGEALVNPQPSVVQSLGATKINSGFIINV
jgi:hypothetical protein